MVDEEEDDDIDPRNVRAPIASATDSESWNRKKRFQKGLDPLPHINVAKAHRRGTIAILHVEVLQDNELVGEFKRHEAMLNRLGQELAELYGKQFTGLDWKVAKKKKRRRKDLRELIIPQLKGELLAIEQEIARRATTKSAHTIPVDNVTEKE